MYAATVERELILHLFDYHHWAGDRTLGATAALGARQLGEPWGGSFGTGRALLRHVVGVERLWCERWNGRSASAIPDYPATWSGRDYLAEWTRVKADQVAWLSEMTRDMLAGDFTYSNTKGERATFRLAEVMLHLVNHGTYHRGQLTHLLRDRGLSAPSTDYIVFVRERRLAD